MSPLRARVRAAGLAIARTIGTQIIDQRTGQPLGRALIIPWRGKIHVIGLSTAVRPMFLPQERLTYWKQEFGFATHEPPDFPSEATTLPRAEEGAAE